MNSDTTASVSFLERLRNETTDAHTALERIPVSAAILKPEVTKEEYADYLKLMFEVVSALETEVHPKISTIISDLSDRKKAKDLANDLSHIGGTIPLDGKNPFETTNDKAFNLGIAYVVEGSTLGGRFILKNIQANLGLDENAGATYFAGYGNKTGSMWKSFLNEMTGFASKTNSENQIIAGANHAFEAIHKHLSA
ncbi:biliverdin-producing heme oxygenase [Flavobacterium sp.]|uniref:biliverdin-producing heme oxygenase n=1 Tax=Flavobacterium sp. TaxID=239 RepID=UPI0012092B7B|nr:biliverdin-producing heme oxygenase [Flavobacterium sp.]RZJ69706.1 MAG: heme oxygenase [Flavobacterium sp.]